MRISSGVFAARAVWDIGAGWPLGLIEGGDVIVAQIVATAITWVDAAVVSFVLLKVLDVTMGLRAAQQNALAWMALTGRPGQGFSFFRPLAVRHRLPLSNRFATC